MSTAASATQSLEERPEALVDHAVQHGPLGVARLVVHGAEGHSGDIDSAGGRRQCPKRDTPQPSGAAGPEPQGLGARARSIGAARARYRSGRKSLRPVFPRVARVIAQNPPRLRARVPHQRPGAARSRRRDRSHGRERCRKGHPVDRARRRGPARRRLNDRRPFTPAQPAPGRRRSRRARVGSGA